MLIGEVSKHHRGKVLSALVISRGGEAAAQPKMGGLWPIVHPLILCQ